MKPRKIRAEHKAQAEHRKDVNSKSNEGEEKGVAASQRHERRKGRDGKAAESKPSVRTHFGGMRRIRI